MGSRAPQSFRPTRRNLLRSRFPPGIRSRYVPNINGLTFHVLEAGLESKERPCLLLLHGYPEIEYGWRKVMLPLASAGFHVLAPDMRGYGRTIGWDDSYDGDVFPFRHTNLVRDAFGLVSAFGYRTAAVVGRDAGSAVAAYCALIRPDVFRSVAMIRAHSPVRLRCPLIQLKVRHRPRQILQKPERSTTNWRNCRDRASITKCGTRRAKLTTTCVTAGRASPRSFVPTIT